MKTDYRPLVWIVPVAVLFAAYVAYQNNASSPSIANPPAAPAPVIRLLPVRVQPESESMVSFNGEVKNISNEPLSGVVIMISVYDSDNKIIRTLRTSPDLDPLGPGNTSPFSAMVTDVKGFDHYAITFRSLRGELIPSDPPGFVASATSLPVPTSVQPSKAFETVTGSCGV